jgi:hypothetical protein
MVMTAPGRLATALAVMAVSVALPFARTPAEPAHPVPTVSFSAMGLSFRYPAAWRHASFSNDMSSFSGNVVDLGTSRLHDPCIGGPAEGAMVCSGFPVDTLAPGEVLVEWTSHGFPNWHLPKPNTTIAGRPAVETKTSGGSCAPVGGTETITVIIPRGTPDNWYQMDACLSAPNLPQQEPQIAAMLSTVQIASGDLVVPRTLVGHAAPGRGVMNPAALPTTYSV